MRSRYLVLALLGVFFLAGCVSKTKDVSKGKNAGLVVENNKNVSLHYTLHVDGKVVESSAGHPALIYKHGSRQIIPGLQRQLEGLRVGDKKKITVTPEEGYGKIMPNAIKEVKRSVLPANSKPQVGMFVEVKSTDGRAFRARITDLKKDTIVLDFNHPLAGKTLVFDVEIISII